MVIEPPRLDLDDVVDAMTKKLVWEGAVMGRVTDSALRNLEKTIDDAVAAIMESFPVGPVAGS